MDPRPSFLAESMLEIAFWSAKGQCQPCNLWKKLGLSAFGEQVTTWVNYNDIGLKLEVKLRDIGSD
jgi:hypothetical protein